MNDPVLGSLAYPCDECGAEPGEECPDSCPGAADFSEVDAQAFIDSWSEEIPPLEESEGKLMAEVHRLPFGRLAGDAPQRATMSRELWMAQLAAWMVDYRAVLDSQLLDLQRQSRRCISLQLERDVMRRFLTGAPASASCATHLGGSDEGA